MLASIGQKTRRGVSLLALCLLVMPSAHARSCVDWPLWSAFSSRFIQSDGRVLADESEHRYSTSEGQAYALFFSLIANDRNAFDRILIWTRENLAAADLTARLPAWQWGKKPDGHWGVVDANSASDADTWLAYTLLEAGRLWREPRYTAQGNLMLANIRIRLIRDFPGLGAMLLPAEAGFDLEQGGSRINPSYFPVQLLRAFAKTDPSGPWNEVINNNLKLLEVLGVRGFVPDWAAYVPGKGYMADPQHGSKGSYDAIRVYLWWGMLSKRDPVAAKLKKNLYGMNRLIPRHEIVPPLTVNAQTGVPSGIGPPSFSAALLPYFASMGNKEALRLQRDRLLAQRDANGLLIGNNPRYYDQVLTLFGQGWMEHRFSFSSQGQLAAKWKSSCPVIR